MITTGNRERFVYTTDISSTSYLQPDSTIATTSYDTSVSTSPAALNTNELAALTTTVTNSTLRKHLADPTFTGVPAAPTAATGTNTTRLATTAFVMGLSVLQVIRSCQHSGSGVYVSSRALTVTLPVSATIGDKIGIVDGTGNASTNNITIARNGHKIQGLSEDMTVAKSRAAFELVYYNTTNGWLLTSV